MKKGTKHSDATKKQISKKVKKLYLEGKTSIKEFEFKKGGKAWNKNLKGLHLNPTTEFKKGQFVGKNHPSWKGGVQKVKKDCIHLWTGANERVRRPREMYKIKVGNIPKGFIIFHKDGNKNNDNLDNLIAISRAELLWINQNQKI